MKIYLMKCNEKTRKKDDLPCKPDDEIEKYMKTKKLYIESLNTKINFSDLKEELPIR